MSTATIEYESTTSDERSAARAFDEIRARLVNAQPVLELRNEVPVLARKAPDSPVSGELQRLQVLVWKPDEENLSHVTLPWWLLRLKEGPIDISAEAGAGYTTPRVLLTVEEVERYGPAVLLDHIEPDGSRFLVWTE